MSNDVIGAESLATADVLLWRCAPNLCAEPSMRRTAALVIERDKADLLAVLTELAEALDGNAEVNQYTGEFATLVRPEWFGLLKRALLKHAGVECLPHVALRARALLPAPRPLEVVS
jgi:hypothetical protein